MSVICYKMILPVLYCTLDKLYSNMFFIVIKDALSLPGDLILFEVIPSEVQENATETPERPGKCGLFSPT